MKKKFSLDGFVVRTLTDIRGSVPGRIVILPAGSLAVAHAASNLPENSEIEYWLEPVGDWEPPIRQVAENIGVGVSSDEIERVK
jgi:hypothetical protein